MVDVCSRRARLRAGLGVRGTGMGVACGGRRPAWLLARRQPIRGRAASRHRHRPRRRPRRESSGLGRGDVCRAGPDSRPDGDHLHRRRPQGVADAPRDAARQARRRGRGRGPSRRAGPVGRAGTRCAVCPSRDPCRGRRHVRRSPLAPSAAGRAHPSAGSRGSARASSRSSSRGPGSATAVCVAATGCGASASSSSSSSSGFGFGFDPDSGGRRSNGRRGGD